MKSKSFYASIILVSIAIIWGAGYSTQAIAAQNLQSITIIFTKYIGFICLLPIVIADKCKFTLRSFLYGFIVAITGAFGCLLQQEGIKYSTAAKTSFITALYIIFVAIFGFLFKKKPEKKIWIAIPIAIVGMYFLCANGESLAVSAGDLYPLGGSMLLALQILFIDKGVEKDDPLTISFISQGLSALIFGVLMLIVDKPTIMDFKNALWPVLYSILISGVLAQTLQIIYQKDVEPSLASLLLSLESVFGALGGWLILGQSLSIREIAGCVIIFIAILIANKKSE